MRDNAFGMVEATIEDLAFPSCSSKEHDQVMRRGCIEHTFRMIVGLGLKREHLPSESR